MLHVFRSISVTRFPMKILQELAGSDSRIDRPETKNTSCFWEKIRKLGYNDDAV